jgi:serine/threonine protein kinase
MKCASCNAEKDPAAETCFTCGKSFTSAKGSVFAQRYEILSLLGKGGMGMVYKAKDRALDEIVVLKTMRSQLAGDSDMVRRFRAEVRMARRIRHKNICAIHDYGEEGNLLYISMEFIDGIDLKQILREEGGFAADEGYNVAIQVAKGLEAIHEAGVIHRDLKSHNIMRDTRGVIKLLDFGIAKQEDAEGGMTGTGQIVGTPEYMSPEQVRAGKVDSRSDLYAVGIVIFEIFTGQVPFRGDTPVVTIFKHLQEEPPLTGPPAAGIPEALVPVLTKLLAKNPADRYQSAGDVIDALRQARAATLPEETPVPLASPTMVRQPIEEEISLTIEEDITRTISEPTSVVRVPVSRPAPPPPGASVEAPPAAEAEQAQPDLARTISEAPVPPLPPRVVDPERPTARTTHEAPAPGQPAAVAEAPVPPTDTPLPLHENVQFTVYRPHVVQPMHWYTLLAFAHLEELPSGASEDEPPPIEQVTSQAESEYGDRIRDYTQVRQDSSMAIPHEAEITFVPDLPGFEINPPRRTFLWLEPVHREKFRIRAGADMEGAVIRGRMSVFWGRILISELLLSMRVEGHQSVAAAHPAAQRSARPFRKIFASYSHKDVVIVQQFDRYVRTLGDVYLRDITHLRAGEVWGERVQAMIREADVFQLFWSWNALRSVYVEREWRYALSLERPHFIRPTYWEEPLPVAPERDMPPEVLRRLHFHLLPGGIRRRPSARPASSPSRPPAPGAVGTPASAGDTGRFRAVTEVRPAARAAASPRAAAPPEAPARRPPVLLVLLLVTAIFAASLAIFLLMRRARTVPTPPRSTFRADGNQHLLPSTPRLRTPPAGRARTEF